MSSHGAASFNQTLNVAVSRDYIFRPKFNPDNECALLLQPLIFH
jgi:hypothetical protein